MNCWKVSRPSPHSWEGVFLSVVGRTKLGAYCNSPSGDAKPARGFGECARRFLWVHGFCFLLFSTVANEAWFAWTQNVFSLWLAAGRRVGVAKDFSAQANEICSFLAVPLLEPWLPVGNGFASVSWWTLHNPAPLSRWWGGGLPNRPHPSWWVGETIGAGGIQPPRNPPPPGPDSPQQAKPGSTIFFLSKASGLWEMNFHPGGTVLQCMNWQSCPPLPITKSRHTPPPPQNGKGFGGGVMSINSTTRSEPRQGVGLRMWSQRGRMLWLALPPIPKANFPQKQKTQCAQPLLGGSLCTWCHLSHQARSSCPKPEKYAQMQEWRKTPFYPKALLRVEVRESFGPSSVFLATIRIYNESGRHPCNALTRCCLARSFGPRVIKFRNFSFGNFVVVFF